MARSVDVLQGTLDLLILKTLSWGPAHGYAIARWIEQLTGEVLRIGEGSLYPALERLQRSGWVTSKWAASPTGRRARYYSITASGRRALGEEVSAFREMNEAIARVLNPEPESGN